MRFFTLTTLERRSGTSFQLKSGLITIGTMMLNGSKACHEMELTEPDYLKHAKAIAQLCRVPGCAVYVSSIRDDAPEPIVIGKYPWTHVTPEAPAATMECGCNPGDYRDDCKQHGSGVQIVELQDATAAESVAGENSATGNDTENTEASPDITELTKDTPFFTLRSIAKREGVDISALTTNADRAAAINESRKLAVA